MVSRLERVLICGAILAVSLVGDQLTKRIAISELKWAPARSFFHDVFRLQYAENRGALLSLGAELPPAMRFWLLTAGVGVLLLFLLGYTLTHQNLSRLQVVGLALILGGGASNLLDRIMDGGVVVDFMNLGLGPTLRTGIFNVADLAIVAGVIVLLLRRPAAPPPSEASSCQEGGLPPP